MIAERGVDPALCEEHAVLGLGFVIGPTRTRRHDGRAVVARHVGVGRIDVGIPVAVDVGDSVAGVVDEEFLAAEVRLAHRDVDRLSESSVVLAELGVLVAVGVLVLVLLPQEGQGDVLAPELGSDTTTPIEFEAWARGADEMLARTDQANDRPYLLVSVGTGTSALRVDGDSVERMGGTALGGGAALGLGRAIIGARTPEELNDLALEGTRQNVDLMVSDLFEDASDVGAFIASSFGKVARSAADERPNEPSRADLAAALLGIVSDNIGLLASAYARAAGVDRIVYGGSTFLVHPQFADVARAFGMINGVDTVVLSQGGHAGSLGAMVIARRESAAA